MNSIHVLYAIESVRSSQYLAVGNVLGRFFVCNLRKISEPFTWKLSPPVLCMNVMVWTALTMQNNSNYKRVVGLYPHCKDNKGNVVKTNTFGHSFTPIVRIIRET